MSLPVLSVAQMREWEQASWDAGCTEAEVISRVGQSIGKLALELTSTGDLILILAGKGHNGDDARCAVLHLPGREVRLLNVHNPANSLQELSGHLRVSPALIIDGLFGIGLNRDLSPDWIEFIETINQASFPVLAVDVPSGLNAETGETHGVAIYAQITLTVGAPKNGLLKNSAAPFVGRLDIAANVGLVECNLHSDLQWTVETDFKGFPPPRRADSHKGTHGHLALVAGSEGYHGAAVLAARGALRSMPGLVSVFCEDNVYIPIASQLAAPMVHRCVPGKALPENISTIVMGPGLASPDLGTEWREFLNEQWFNFPMPVLVDASALEWLEPGATPLNSRRIITPHPGEAARMLGTKSAGVQENRPAALRELSTKYGNCWVVLKGYQTLIGRSSGDIFVNSTGNPLLGQGGSGDVLSGYLGGLLAQSRLQAQPLKTIRHGVWQHGASADFLSRTTQSWGVEDLLNILGDRPSPINPG